MSNYTFVVTGHLQSYENAKKYEASAALGEWITLRLVFISCPTLPSNRFWNPTLLKGSL